MAHLAPPLFPASPAADVVRSGMREIFALDILRDHIQKATEVILGARPAGHRAQPRPRPHPPTPLTLRRAYFRSASGNPAFGEDQHGVGHAVLLRHNHRRCAEGHHGLGGSSACFEAADREICCTVSAGSQTMGEEYCDIIQFSERTGSFPNLFVRQGGGRWPLDAMHVSHPAVFAAFVAPHALGRDAHSWTARHISYSANGDRGRKLKQVDN